MEFKRVNRAEATYIKVGEEYLPFLGSSPRANSDGLGNEVFYTPKGDFGSKQIRGFYNPANDVL